MDSNPSFIKRQLMKVDMGIFYWIMCTFRGFVTIIDHVLDILFGYTIQHGSREERRKSKEYEHSAQVVSLMGRGAYSVVLNHQLHNFVWRHERYVHPKYVLEHDNITLMGVTPTHAFFCVSEPDFDIYETKMAPFLFIIQFFAAKKLVIVPHYSFNRLAVEVGDPSDRRLTFVNMTARCGSTLLSQMISRTDKVRTMSEPWSLVHVHGLFNTKKISMPEYKRLLRSVVRLQCKRERGRDVEHIFIKTTMFMAPAFPLLMEMFPKAKYIFNTRQWVPSVESYMQLAQFMPLLVYYTGAQFQFWWGHLQIPYDDPFLHQLHRDWYANKGWDTTQPVKLSLGFAAQVSEFLRNRDKYDMIVFYEDILSNPEDVCKKLLKVCDISLEYVPKALEALKSDSQKGTFGKRGNKPKLDQADLDWADRVFAECGVPISHGMSLEAYKKLILTGTYNMK